MTRRLEIVLFFGPLVAVAAAIALATRGTTAVPAPPLAAAVAIALLGGALLLGRPRRALAAFAAAGLGLCAAVLHLGPGLVSGHSTNTHAWGAWAWLQAWKAGDFLPIWLHHIGLGQPLPLFYGPLPFWLMAPFAALQGSAPAMLRGTLALASVVAALSAWRAVLSWTRDPRAALVAAAAWAYAPWRLAMQNYVVDVGEAWALALAPLVLGSFDGLLRRRGRRRFARAAGATALVALAHPLTLATLLAPLAAMGVAAGVSRRSWRAAARAASRSIAAGVVGLALAGFFTVPLLVEKRHTSLEQSLLDWRSQPLSQQHGVHPGQLVRRDLWGGIRWSYAEQDEPHNAPEMPFYAGILLLGALLAGLLAWRGGRRRHDPLRNLASAGAVSVLLSLAPVARWTPDLWLFTVLQFPWRRLGIASAAAALVVGLLAARWRPDRRARPLWLSSLAILAVADGFPHSGAASRYEPWRGAAMVADAERRFEPERFPGPLPFRIAGPVLPPYGGGAPAVSQVGPVFSEYLTPSVRATVYRGRWERLAVGAVRARGRVVRPESLPYARPVGDDGALLDELEFVRGAGRIEISTGGDPGRIEVAEQYFPGWQVEAGGRWREAAATADGLLTATVPAGVDRVRFRFDRWRWDRSLGWLLSLVSVLALAGALRRRGGDRSRRRPMARIRHR